MSNIKIIDGSFKKQSATYVAKSIFTPEYAFLVDAGNGEKRIYNMRAALTSIETIIDDKKHPTVKIVLKDGANVIASMKRDVLNQILIAKALAVSDDNYLYSKQPTSKEPVIPLSWIEKEKQSAKRIGKIILFCFVVGILYAVISDNEPSSTPSSTPAPVAQITNNPLSYMTQVEVAHEGARLFDVKREITDEDSIWLTFRMLDQWAALYIGHKDQNLNKTDLEQIAKFKRDLSALQQKAYPRIRQVYATVLHKQLWKNNVEVKAIGAGARTISFIGYQFADNGNIASTQEDLNEQIVHARYKWSRYQPFESGKGTQYKITVPADGQILIWSNGGYDMVE